MAMRILVMRVLVTALAIALMTADASAQGVGGMGGGAAGGHQQPHGKTDKIEPAKPKVDEKDYNAALKSIPDKHPDAWSGMR
jgi:hypothetical protein